MVAESVGADVGRPLLATKLDPPVPVPGLVVRPGLVDRLLTRTSVLTVLVAPAGWGKSSLISAWFEADVAPQRFAFLRLGVDDDDPRTFWAYMSGAIGGIVEDWAPPIQEALQVQGLDPTKSLVPNIINALHDQEEELIVVLDDFHLINDPEIHRSIDYLLDNAPRCLRLAIASRFDPPLSLARRRAQGSVAEIRENDLRLSTGGVQQLLQRRFAIDINDEDAETLRARTEGWPAGIQLAGVSMAADRATDPTEFIATFAGDDRNIADYLTTEVLRRQPEHRRHFILTTAMLEEFTADLCNYLLDINNAGTLLTEIEEQNLFLICLDSRREWFRYHHLLRDWLRHLQLASASPAAIIDLHRRASRWLQDHGLVERAIGHLIDAGDIEEAAELMDGIATPVSIMGHMALRRWIQSVPEEYARDKPALALARVSWLGITSDEAAALRQLDVAERAIANLDHGHYRGLVETTAQLHRGIFALRAGDMDSATRVFDAIVTNNPPTASHAGANAQGLLGIALFWTAGPEAALPHMVQAAANRERLSMPDLVMPSFLAASYAELGRWDEAEAIALESFAQPGVERSPFPFTMAAHYAMAEVYQHRGDMIAALSHAELGLDEARAWGQQPYYIGWGCLVLAGLTEDRTQRRDLLSEAKQQTMASNGLDRLLRRIEAAENRLARRLPNRPPQSSRTLASGMILDPLTARELDVLRMMRGDLTVREIGSELFISYNTAKGYTKTIYQKLAVNSRAEAVAVAQESDLL